MNDYYALILVLKHIVDFFLLKAQIICLGFAMILSDIDIYIICFDCTLTFLKLVVKSYRNCETVCSNLSY